jgi:inositol phosphorylceramide mannosyltransferase catalytic subunit
VQSIPRIFHQVWPGRDPIPEKYQRFAKGWREKHLGWDYRLWTPDNIAELECSRYLDEIRGFSCKSNVVRLEVVHTHGGVYADLDFECLKNFEPLLEEVTAFAGYEDPGMVCNALFGAVPSHPWIAAQLQRVVPELLHRPPPWGPTVMTEEAARFKDVTIFPCRYFYPYSWWQRALPSGMFPDTYAVHHWDSRWSPSRLKYTLGVWKHRATGWLFGDNRHRAG